MKSGLEAFDFAVKQLITSGRTLTMTFSPPKKADVDARVYITMTIDDQGKSRGWKLSDSDIYLDDSVLWILADNVRGLTK